MRQGEAAQAGQARQGAGAQRRQAVGGQVEGGEAGQAAEGAVGQAGNAVGREVELTQRGQPAQPRHAGDAVAVQAQPLQRGEAGRQVGRHRGQALAHQAERGSRLLAAAAVQVGLAAAGAEATRQRRRHLGINVGSIQVGRAAVVVGCAWRRAAGMCGDAAKPCRRRCHAVCRLRTRLLSWAAKGR